MRTYTKTASLTALVAKVSIVGLLFLSGCLEKRIVWSPDGSHAAVISDHNLYLCDAEGKLSSLLVSNVHGVVWLDDSQRMVLSRSRVAKDWDTISKVLGRERANVAMTQAESMWQSLQAGSPWSVVGMDLKEDKWNAVKICLRDRHGADLRAKLSESEWKDIESKSVELNQLAMARIAGDKVEIGTTLHEDFGGIMDMRSSPQSAAIAFTVEMKPESDDLRLLVVPTDGSMPATAVASNTAAYPDWTANGRAVVYFEASVPSNGKDVPSLGVLTQRAVLDEGGRIKMEEKPEYLAGGMFNGFTRVRCLRDGRILFNAAEFSLPITGEDYGGQKEQLFALDLARQATLVRIIPRKAESDLPDSLTFFEVSPDEKQVLFGGEKGIVCLLTVTNGQVNVIQSRGKDDLQGLPVWRKAGEFTYMKRIEPEKAGTDWLGLKRTEPTASNMVPRKVEVVLRRGDQETVLSQSWPDDVVERLVESGSK